MRTLTMKEVRKTIRKYPSRMVVQGDKVRYVSRCSPIIPIFILVFSFCGAAEMKHYFDNFFREDITLAYYGTVAAIAIPLFLYSLYDAFIKNRSVYKKGEPFIIFKDRLVASSIQEPGWFYIGEVWAYPILQRGSKSSETIGRTVLLNRCKELKGYKSFVIPHGGIAWLKDCAEYYFIYLPEKKMIRSMYACDHWRLSEELQMYYRELEDIEFPPINRDYKTFRTPSA